MDREKEAIDKLKEYGQNHIVNILEKLDETKKQELIEQINKIDFHQMMELYQNTKKEIEFKESKIEPVPYLDKAKLTKDQREEFDKLGEEIVKNNQYAVVTMAGGQGTRLGHTGPKGTFKLDVYGKGKYLFEILAENLKDLKEKLGNIIVGYNYNDEPIYAKQLKANGAMTVLLKDAIKPNLVQTLEHTPALVHGGPFANIAHGCNSVIATKTALKLADYTITEAGFGADLGAEKFLDIKCRKANIKPDVVVIVATIKAIKYHGGVDKEDIQKENIKGLENGIENLYRHIDNMKNKFGLNVIVALNKYTSDTEKELNWLEQKLKEKNIEMSIVEGWKKGGEGAIDIAKKIVKNCSNTSNIKENNFNFIYKDEETIKEKIQKVATKIYGAQDVEYSEEAEQKIEKIEKTEYGKLPVCIAKTQYSFSDDTKNLECNNKYNIHVRDVELKAGAGFIVVIAGKIMTMPGLPKIPAAEQIDIDENDNIIGIF